MMEADRFQNAVIAELAALKYIVEQIGEIAFLAATMRIAGVTIATSLPAGDELPRVAEIELVSTCRRITVGGEPAATGDGGVLIEA